jgi:hypothetical protein
MGLDTDSVERIYPAGDGDERAVLTGWLDWQRVTVRRKVEGLSDPDAYRPLLPDVSAHDCGGSDLALALD